MIFKDTIEIWEAGQTGEDEYGEPIIGPPVLVATIPAQVDVERTSLDAGNLKFQSVTQLVAYCKPFEYNQRTQSIWWRGQKYAPNGPMLERTIQGRVHHIELPLQLVEG